MSNDSTPTQLTVRNRLTVPIYGGKPRLQQQGSVIYDYYGKQLCYSDGTQWKCALTLDASGSIDAMCGDIINLKSITGGCSGLLTISNPGGSGVDLCDVSLIKGSSGRCITIQDLENIIGCSGATLTISNPNGNGVDLCDVVRIKGQSGSCLTLEDIESITGCEGATLTISNPNGSGVDLCDVVRLKGQSGSCLTLEDIESITGCEGAALTISNPNGNGVDLCDVVRLKGQSGSCVVLEDIESIDGCSGMPLVIRGASGQDICIGASGVTIDFKGSNITNASGVTNNLIGGFGISVSSPTGTITITNTQPANIVSLTSGGTTGSETIVFPGGGIGPGLVTKGITAGSNITLTSTISDIIISSAGGATGATGATGGIGGPGATGATGATGANGAGITPSSLFFQSAPAAMDWHIGPDAPYTALGSARNFTTSYTYTSMQFTLLVGSNPTQSLVRVQTQPVSYQGLAAIDSNSLSALWSTTVGGAAPAALTLPTPISGQISPVCTMALARLRGVGLHSADPVDRVETMNLHLDSPTVLALNPGNIGGQSTVFLNIPTGCIYMTLNLDASPLIFTGFWHPPAVTDPSFGGLNFMYWSST